MQAKGRLPERRERPSELSCPVPFRSLSFDVAFEGSFVAVRRGPCGSDLLASFGERSPLDAWPLPDGTSPPKSLFGLSNTTAPSRLAKASMGPERSVGGGACATMRAGELSPDEEA